MRKALKRLWRALTTPFALVTLAAIVLCLLIWFLGPLVAFGEVRLLGSIVVRLTLVLLIVLAWGIGIAVTRGRRSKEEEALLGALRRQQQEEKAEAARREDLAESEFAAFREQAQTALRLLRRERGAFLLRRSLYRLPWYVSLGADGAGKSSLVRNAGLTLPFDGAARPGEGGGFIISDQAVFVEIAGRYLTQPAEHHARVWLRILAYLKRLRPRWPLNGILLTVSADALIAMTDEARETFARAVRHRLDELTARLNARPPVYLVVSKLDLVVGFEEFFDTLSAEERAAILGMPIALGTQPAPSASALNRFEEGFRDLAARVGERQLQRLQEEPDEQRRVRIFEFPGQFALLLKALGPFVATITASHSFESLPFLRGVLFASAAQSGLSVDTLGAPLAAVFEQREEKLGLGSEVDGRRSRPFFLRGLFRDVIIAEAELGGRSRRATLMEQGQTVAAAVLLSVAAVALGVLVLFSYTEGKAYSERLIATANQARIDLTLASSGGATPQAFQPALTVLDDLARLDAETPRRATLGLYGTGEAETAAEEAYGKGLVALLLPFVMRHLENGLDDDKTGTALRLQELKLYLMFGGNRTPDPDVARSIAADFAARWLPDEPSRATEERIGDHLAALARARPPQQPMAGKLVDNARRRIADVTLAKLAYDALRGLPAVKERAMWRPVDHMAAAGPRAMSRVSGASLWDGVPGLYTRAGFREVILPASRTVAEALAADLWAMGLPDGLDDTLRETQRIRDGVLDLYRVDYIRQWDSLLSDLSLAPVASAGEAADALAILIGKPSPVKDLVVAVATEADLTPPDAASAAGVAAIAADPATALEGKIVDRLAANGSPRRVTDIGRTVTEHFKRLRDAVNAPEGAQAQIDVVLAALEPLYRQLNHVATGGDILELGAQPQTTLAQITDLTSKLPPSLQPLFRRILNQSAALAGSSSRARLSQIWGSTVLPSCQATVARYPFDPKARDDAPLEDFTALFGPKGGFASFRNDYLKPFIDTTSRPWKWRQGQQVGLGLGDDVLAAFERADAVTRTFFAEGDALVAKFLMEPVSLDAAASAFQFDIGGATLSYAHGPATPVPAQWPAKPGADASLSVTPEVVGQRNAIRQEGAWALFRLIAMGKPAAAEQPEVVDVGFTVGTRRVALRLTAPTANNPFAKDLLAGFVCPKI